MAIQEDNTIKEITSSSNATVLIIMDRPMSSAILEKFRNNPHLRYWDYPGSPQNPKDTGFFAASDHQAISFPK